MSISVANTKTAVNAYIVARAATATALTAITTLGPCPTYPVDVVADADYTTQTTAINAWNASYGPLQTTYLAAVAAQHTAELAVIAVCYPDQWVTLTGLTGISPTTQYVGYASAPNVKTLVMSAVAPTQNFPLL